ncbi:hypothetical protein E2C01_061577 [Portunus trituberculatus]|uniref:Uncharacterized protein n=1 Tax=Portunus trituberculatus TaxID=210409 RepID=A0A5B7H8I9_PORTR|nr:hypothetical protein [Portunus trituberculatus]
MHSPADTAAASRGRWCPTSLSASHRVHSWWRGPSHHDVYILMTGYDGGSKGICPARSLG